MRSPTTGSDGAHLALGDTREAARFLRRARDEDLLKFRAPARTDSIIHSGLPGGISSLHRG